jgi:transposase
LVQEHWSSERLDVIPAKFRVIITRRPKYAFKGWDGVIQALAPSHIIESGLPSEALLAQIAVSKYADGLPLYRQEGIYARDGVELDRRLMAQWMGRVGFELDILADMFCVRSSKATGSLWMKPACQPSPPATAARKKPRSGPMPATTRLLAEAVRPW